MEGRGGVVVTAWSPLPPLHFPENPPHNPLPNPARGGQPVDSVGKASAHCEFRRVWAVKEKGTLVLVRSPPDCQAELPEA